MNASRRPAFEASLTLTLVTASFALAEAGPPNSTEARERRGRTIEEIIVTAQKVPENVLEVPISMTVLDDEALRQEGVTGLDDAARLIPNFSVVASSFGTTARVRGFETGIVNKGFEQAVGLLLDGVIYGRKQYFEAALYDLERLEVLRGPQGTLFGKNNSAGLVHLVTKNPTAHYTGSIDLQYGELDRRRIELGIGGPIVEGLLHFRVAALGDERDGYVRNTTAAVVPGAAGRFGSSDRKGIRAKLGLPDLFGANVVLSYEKFRIDERSNVPAEILGETSTETQEVLLRLYDPNVDFDSGNFVGSQDHPGVSFRDFDTFVASGRYEVGPWSIDAIVGHALLEVFDEADADFTPSPAVSAIESDDNIQTTVELRTTSPPLAGIFGMPLPRLLAAPSWPSLDFHLGTTEFTAGFFYQRRLIRDSLFQISADPVALVPFLVAREVTGPARPLLGPGLRSPEGLLEQTLGFYRQTSDTIAGFGQIRWHLGERWTLLSGFRLSNETKRGDWERRFNRPGVILLQLAFEEFSAHRKRSEFEFSPKVSLEYEAAEGIHAYATWAVGYRPGGFNEFAGTADPERLEFDRERAQDWELGAKMDLFDGTARLNLGLFRTEVDDFQVLTNQTGGVLLIAVNAGGAVSRGIEADFTWRPTSWLATTAALGYLDAHFLDFPFGGCTQDNGPPCDRSGDPLPNAPKWKLSWTPSVAIPLASVPLVGGLLSHRAGAITLTSHLTMEYEDTHYLREFIDQRLRQGSFFRFHASFGFADPERRWSLRVIGENLTDEAIATTGAEFPVVGPPLSKAYAPPRLFFGQLRWEFS